MTNFHLENLIVIEPFSTEHQDAVTGLILGIQNNEFGIAITLDDQKDLCDIPGFYQIQNGNFWVALENNQVVGTIALLDIGAGLVALRKMFVHPDYRGKSYGTAQKLLQTALDWCREKNVQSIYLGTTEKFLAAHRFYEKNGFLQIPHDTLPPTFPVMHVDTKFYQRNLRDA